MKMAILGTRGIPARYGGFETFAEEVSSRLVERGVDVTVYCEAMDRRKIASYKKIKLKYVPSFSAGPLTTILFDLRCLWHARRSFDVVYMLGYGAALFCFIPRLWGKQVWINMDGIEWARAKWNWLAKIWFKLMEAIAMWTANRIIADAEGIRRHLESRHRYMPDCSVIPYGAPVFDGPPDPAPLKEWGLDPNGYYLVVCRLEPENHVLEIIEGFSRSSSSSLLVIVGAHLSGTIYVQRLLHINDERLRFIGTVFDQRKLQALRCHARVYFHGHSVGGTNPSLLEALGCGNIIIAHDNFFNREVAGDVGLYFKGPGDIPEILAAVDSYSPEQQRVKADAARCIIREKYDWDMIAAGYLSLIHESTSIPVVKNVCLARDKNLQFFPTYVKKHRSTTG